MEGGRAGLEVRRKGMSKVKKEKAEGNRKKEAKKYKNKCRRLRVADDSVVDLSLHGREIWVVLGRGIWVVLGGGIWWVFGRGGGAP